MLSKFRKKGSKRILGGFTLIELMRVIIIIGILAALAIVRFSSATKKTKLREAAQMLGYLYDLQYSYYVENGEFITQAQTAMSLGETEVMVIFQIVFFELNTGIGWIDDRNVQLQRMLNYNSPSGKSHFYYITSPDTGDGCITWAYPKISEDFWNFPDEETVDDLEGIRMCVDNDRRIYIFNYGNMTEL